MDVWWALYRVHYARANARAHTTFWWEKSALKLARSVSHLTKEVQIDFYPSPSFILYVSENVFLSSKTSILSFLCPFFPVRRLFYPDSRCLSVTWFKAVFSVRSWRPFRLWLTTETSSARRQVGLVLVFTFFQCSFLEIVVRGVSFVSPGMNMQAMDTSSVCLVQMELNADGFEPYRCDKNITLGIDLKK